MSESGSSGNGSSTKKWDWSNPQNVLAVAGIVAGLAGSVFGVAMAAPYGQDLLCKTFGVSCPRIEARDTKFNISAVDFDGWCASWLKSMENEQFPPPAYTGSTADCRWDAWQAGPTGYTKGIAFSMVAGADKSSDFEAVTKSIGTVLIGHLSMRHTKTAAETPFSLRADCWRDDPAAEVWVHIDACELSAPMIGIDSPFPASSYTSAPVRQADGSLTLTMAKDELDFIQRWRLDVDGQTTADLAPGAYRVDLAIGAPGEAIEPLMISTIFDIASPAPQQQPDPN